MTLTPDTTVRTVPATIASLALDAALPSAVGRRMGQRVEVDVDAVRSRFGSDAAVKLLRYYRRVLSFREGAGGRYVDTRRTLVAAKLLDPKGGRRVYLTDQLAGLRMLAGVGPVVDALLAPERSVAKARQLGEVFRARVSTDGNRSVLTMVVPAAGEWSQAVGGPVGPDEVFREVTVETNHATSRRSVSHRLMAVEVRALERFPDPADG